MKTTWTTIGIAVLIALFATGCSIEEAIEDLTNRNMTVNQTLFDGPTAGGDRTASLVENLVVKAGEDASVITADLSDVADSLLCYRQDLEPAALGIFGRITNPSSNGVTLMLSLGNGIDEDSIVRLGTIYIPGGQTAKIRNNKGFEQKAREIEATLYEFFADNPGIDKVNIYAELQGGRGTGVLIKWMDFSSPPAYRIIQSFADAMDNGYSGHVKSVNSVALTGTIENLGESEIRFMLVTGKDLSTVDFEGGLVADGFVAPGQSVQVSDIVVDKGLSRIKNKLNDALNGADSMGNVFILSEGTVDATVDSLEIEAKITVGL